MPNLSKKVQNFAHANGLFFKKQKIVVGVSGGADSVCLLSLLLELSRKYDFRLHVAHVNYNLRGEDSLKDQDFVEKLAKKNQLDISVISLDKPKNNSNLENELRNMRYDFFETVRASLNFDSIAVAHNMDDQAETLLLRVIRGAGLQGISSMKAKNGNIIRPLLETPRRDIIAYLREKKAKFRIDKTNLESIFTRNKIRLELMPFLEKNFNPNIKENLSRLAEISGNDYEYISKEVVKKFTFEFFEDGSIVFSSKKAIEQHPTIFREGLRRAISTLRSDLVDINLSNIKEIEKIVRSGKNKTQKSSFKGLKIEKKGDKIVMMRSK